METQEETILHYFDKQDISYIKDITTEELIEMFTELNCELCYDYEVVQHNFIRLTAKELADIFWFKQNEYPHRINCYSSEQLLRYIVKNLIAEEKGNNRHNYINGYTDNPTLKFNPLHLNVKVEKNCVQDNPKSEWYSYYFISLIY